MREKGSNTEKVGQGEWGWEREENLGLIVEG